MLGNLGRWGDFDVLRMNSLVKMNRKCFKITQKQVKPFVLIHESNKHILATSHTVKPSLTVSEYNFRLIGTK